MKIRFIPLLICIGIAALVGYGFFAANASDGNNASWIMLVVSTICFFVPLAGAFAIKYKENGSAVGIIALSMVCLIIQLVINLISTFAPFHAAPYIIFSGILVLIYTGITYALSKAL
ncbi:MAG: hypothetical protein ILP07_09490 [Treponema sp.]|nr:hypothetical protein [Treponema sp.]